MGGIWGESPPYPTLKSFQSKGQTWQYNVFLWDTLLDPGPFDQLLLLKQDERQNCHRADC